MDSLSINSDLPILFKKSINRVLSNSMRLLLVSLLYTSNLSILYSVNPYRYNSSKLVDPMNSRIAIKSLNLTVSTLSSGYMVSSINSTLILF